MKIVRTGTCFKLQHIHVLTSLTVSINGSWHAEMSHWSCNLLIRLVMSVNCHSQRKSG